MKYVGIKQVLKAVNAEEVEKVYIGKDVEPHVVSTLLKTCREKKIKVIEISSMEELGKMAGIEVKAATAAE